jgi:Ca2+-binding RTX toxin-like protein
MTNKPYAKRYGTPTPAGAAHIRIPAVGQFSTRFCPVVSGACEVAGAAGPDTLFGDDGDDTMYGQDLNDVMFGGNADDDMYGEMGDDQLYGENGDDAMSGDRGGFVDRYEDGSRAAGAVYDNSQVPKIHYEGFLAGSVTRQYDLQHDVIGDSFVDNAGNVIGTQAVPPAVMPLNGLANGGNDRLRGGNGHDSMHGGVGDDLMNGDSGGDIVFGDDGADVLWGGKGCDAAVDTIVTSADCFTGGVFDPSARGTKDRMVDYILGGKGATTGPSVDPNTGALGSDVIDWRPRGSADTPGTTCTNTSAWPVQTGPKKNPFTIDPCSWFEMTNITAADNTADNQHHQGIDWQYGGWDRDILQADVADNGPNLGDRLLDWNGTYNLYTHCNSAYGGFNDVRQHSPAHQTFLQLWTYTLGGGQVAADAQTAGRSAYDELALVYPGADNAHGSGSAFPSTPGHFDDPNACAP